MNEISNEIQQWITRKFSRRQARLREAAIATYTYRKYPSPRIIFGEVTLSANPSDTFSFTSKVTWPEHDNCEDLVVDGILDVLISSDFYPVVGANFTLEKIGWHEIESVPVAYYFAAREATKQILRLDDKNRNFSTVNSHNKDD